MRIRRLPVMTTCFLLAAAALSLQTASPVSAATVITSRQTAWKKAAKIPSPGSYKVKTTKNHTYLSFTAPKSGTYRFTFSEVHARTKAEKKKDFINGRIRFYKMGTTYPVTEKVRTTFGTSDSVCLASAKFFKSYYRLRPSSAKTVTAYRTKRTAVLRLKKGTTIYCSQAFYGTQTGKISYLLTVAGPRS